MDAATAIVRAHIMCRIFVKLFEAGDGERMPIELDEVGGWLCSLPADPGLVADVVRSLRDEHVIHPPDADRPLEYVLLPDPRSRLKNRMGAMKPLIDLLREDLARVDRGESVPVGNWFDYAVRVSKGQLGREPL